MFLRIALIVALLSGLLAQASAAQKVAFCNAPATLGKLQLLPKPVVVVPRRSVRYVRASPWYGFTPVPAAAYSHIFGIGF